MCDTLGSGKSTKGTRMKKLLDFRDVGSIPVGHTWNSQTTRTGWFKAILFALVTGDWNRFHINPLTLFFFNSNLGGMTCPGDMLLGLTKEAIHSVFDFEEDTEVIAFGYETVKFKKPLRVGERFHYRYTLLERKVLRNNAICKWKIEIFDEQSRTVVEATWTNGYYPVQKSRFGLCALRTFYTTARSLTVFFGTMTLLSPIGWLFYRPPNEWCYPFAP